MWKLCSAIWLLFVTVQAGQNNIYSDFTITPSDQVAYYHYPAPPKSQQFEAEPKHLATSLQYQQQFESIPKPTIPPSSPQQNYYSQSYQNQYQYNNVVPQQQQQQQEQHYQTNVKPQYQNYYQSSSAPAIPHQSSVVTQKFNSPALDNAAFTMALTKQGYTLGNAPASSRSLTTQSQSSALPQLSSSSSSQSPSSSSSSSHSLNVKLPLPFGVTPLNIANLPLQAGAPFAALPTGVTSYGTTYPQKRRR